MTGALTSFLEASVRTATPLALAALGELMVERAGVINIGLEGIVLGGAFGALLGASSSSLLLGFVGGCMAGLFVAALFGLFAVGMRADQVITGTAINLLILGLTGALYRGLYGATGAALTIPTTGSAAVPLLARIPVFGPTFFDQPPPTYLVYVTAPVFWWWLYRTHAGLAVRAVGERLESARVAGIDVRRWRWITVLVGGALGGIAGATLVLSQSGTFAEGMSAGRGFIAIAIVVLGRWRPVGVLIAA
ncbi:MAG TPA: ABC transporter permease, partial [Ramlibacter sp.]|nr:ABC transporter permease [Ramlibacter sp.]